jgi:two-component system OmpR family sensor kinase
LKRLALVAERLMQLARAEGGRLRLDHATDLAPVLRIVAGDLGRGEAPGRLALALPDGPVLSDLDPDAFAILCRNLIENALRHGDPAAPVEVTLGPDGRLVVANEGPVLPPALLARLTERFQRAARPEPAAGGTAGGTAGAGAGSGSGLGLAIVEAIATGAGVELSLHSPRPGRAGGFEARLLLPLVRPGT